MKTAIVIPARYGSTRLPAKPLLRTTGKYLIQHVYEQACKTRADQVIVATDDDRIAKAVESFSGRVMMTRSDHPTGTDRVAEVARQLDADIIINVQGDEPQMEPAAIDLLPELLAKDPEAVVATAGTAITSLDVWKDPTCVKLVRDRRGRALYFSRSPIPFVRDGQPDFAKMPGCFLLHLGLYAYRCDFLQTITKLPPDPLEELEKLEQLRILAHGYHIQVGVVQHASRGIDTPADYERFVQEYRRQAA